MGDEPCGAVEDVLRELLLFIDGLALSRANRDAENDAEVVKVELFRREIDGEHRLFVCEIYAQEAGKVAVAHAAGEVLDRPGHLLHGQVARDVEGRGVGRGGAGDGCEFLDVLSACGDEAFHRAAPVALEAIEGEAVVARYSFGADAAIGERAAGGDNRDLAGHVVQREADRDILCVDLVDPAGGIEGFASVLFVLVFKQDVAIADPDTLGPYAAWEPAEQTIVDVQLARGDRPRDGECLEHEAIGEGMFEVANLHARILAREGSQRPVYHGRPGCRVCEEEVERDPADRKDTDDRTSPDEHVSGRPAPAKVASAFACAAVQPDAAFLNSTPLIVQPRHARLPVTNHNRRRRCWFRKRGISPVNRADAAPVNSRCRPGPAAR